MGSVKITDCRKKYGEFEVIHGINLDIEDREFVVLVGPSGCGKSTLLRMIAGLEDISGGGIEIADRVVNGVPPKDRDIAMVFQNYALYPHLTVAENMGFGLLLRRAPKAEIRKRVLEAARILDLEDYLARYPKQLSGGQRQRVAMGRAIVRDPQVFLFDEPLSNLDAKLRVQMRTEIKALHQKVQTTSIYVTHDQIEAMTLADRVVVLKDGIIMQVGAPLELYDRPDNLFVASFIGSPSMNVMPARLHRDGDRTQAILSNGQMIQLPPGQKGDEGQSVTVGMRPEHLEIVPAGVPGAISALAQFTEPTGSETLVITEVDRQEISVLTRDRPVVSQNEEVALRAAPENVHVFDSGTEQRL